MKAVKPEGMEITLHHRQCWIHFAHQCFDDFGRTGCFQHWKIGKVFEAARYFAEDTPMLELNSVFNKQYTGFVLGVHYNISPELWTVHLGAEFPYKVSVEISDIGYSSMTLYSEMVNKLNNRTLANCLCKLVFVDCSTRRPAPFPDWYYKKLAAMVTSKKRPLTLNRTVPEVPETAHCYNTVVSASDTDINGHTNHTSYVRFCCDAVQAAVKAQALSGFQQDIARYPLIEKQVICIGETAMGDRLQVCLWQLLDHVGKILFVIRRQNAESEISVIFQAYMIFQMKQLELPYFARL